MKPVIVSNGFHKFPIANGAAELHRRGLLAQLITGPYPTRRVEQALRALRPLAGSRLQRVRDRKADLPDGMVRALWWPELLEKLGATVLRLPAGQGPGGQLERSAYRAYGRAAAASVRRLAGQAGIYHYRAGFGHASVAAARRAGMLTVCDHTAAHPALFQHLRTNAGRFPPRGQQGPMTPFWRMVLADIDQADAVMVNSDFVGETFNHQGWDPARVVRVYPGIDERFFQAIPARAPRDTARPAELLYAGLVHAPKGADLLLTALRALPGLDWRLTIAGEVDPSLAAQFPDVLSDPRVRLTGLVRRDEVAALMARADIFVFPSLAEGSARVVYEALASGCYVITTRHSADLVDGEHGAIVPPGDAAAVERAIRQALANRPAVAAMGERNAALIRDHYRQRHYGEQLVEAYETLLDRRAAGLFGAAR